jgi:nitrite reductase/ring-hydroxylating ferredoxin subunit
MKANLSEATVVVAKKKLSSDPSTTDFSVKIKGKIIKGFVVRRGSGFYAYQNLCKHLPVTLDLNDNSFFNHDKTLLQCQMHGALYEMESGLCVGGPCEGARLRSLPLQETDSQLIITFPEEVVAEEVLDG